MLFQFLHGTIKSLHNNQLGIGMKNFNSYMVQLKDYRKLNTRLGYGKFQFLHGTIKRKQDRQLPIQLPAYFNSYMVQLKVVGLAA